jgi:hypothetical protein
MTKTCVIRQQGVDEILIDRSEASWQKQISSPIYASKPCIRQPVEWRWKDHAMKVLIQEI